MKILYVNPGKIDAGLDSVIKGPPLALLSIAAMVPEHDATLFDFKVDRYDEEKFRKMLRAHDITAITSMTPQISHALEVAEMAKQEGSTTIIGGYQPTLAPNSVIENSAVDFIVKGEGEHTFKELVDFLDPDHDNLQLAEIRGISYKDSADKIVHNAGRPLEPNLDNFPIPRRDLLRGKKYQYMGTRVNLMETSRGCPHNCSFCCIIKMWREPDDMPQKMRYRTKSLRRIMEEVYSIYNLKGQSWDFIFFNDDNFTIDVKRAKKIANLLIKSHMNENFYFSCQSRVDTLYKNPELAPLMAKAGFRNIFLGIESIHQQSLDAMNKHTTEEMIRTACKMCKDNQISVFAGMIIGYPGETKKMVRENIEFAIDLNPDFVQFTPITAFPGTDFFKQMEKEHKIATYDYKYYDLFHAMLRTEQLTASQMYHLAAEAYVKFYLNVDYPKMMFNRVVKDGFTWMLDMAFSWTKQFIFGGWDMFRSQGINNSLLEEDETLSSTDKKLRKNKKQSIRNRWREWLKFRKLLKKARKREMKFEDPKLQRYS